MTKHLFIFAFSALLIAAGGSSSYLANAQTGQTPAGAPRAAQQHVIGEVIVMDPATGQISVKTDAGATVSVTVNERTIYRRMPPGETSLAAATTITSGDVKVGDRVLVPGGAALVDGSAGPARQVIVMAREAVAARLEQQREDWRTRGVNGRVVAIDAAKKVLSVETRSREGAQTLTVATNTNSRIRRYAPGSLRPADAVAGSFTDIRVGDQVRVLGNREDLRVTAEEIISGTVTRLVGVVETADSVRGEVVVKDGANGQLMTITLLPTTSLRRVPADFAATIGRGQRRGDGGGGENLTEEQRAARRAARREQGAARRGNNDNPGTAANPGASTNQPRPGGRNPQQMLESFPVITLAELKKGDTVMVMGTGTADKSRVVAATLITGDAELLQRLQRRGPGRAENMSPGLPSGVMGGGTGGDVDRPQPATPPKLR